MAMPHLPALRNVTEQTEKEEVEQIRTKMDDGPMKNAWGSSKEKIEVRVGVM